MKKILLQICDGILIAFGARPFACKITRENGHIKCAHLDPVEIFMPSSMLYWKTRNWVELKWRRLTNYTYCVYYRIRYGVNLSENAKRFRAVIALAKAEEKRRVGEN